MDIPCQPSKPSTPPPADSEFDPTGEYYNEEHRPQHGYSAEGGWMNDPNGLVYHNGTFHLFYQYNPFGNTWGFMHWGHATSSDLIFWNHEPIAIPPGPHGDIFSGNAVIDHDNMAKFGKGAMVAFYTCVGNQDQCISVSLDHGKTLTAYKHNPVIYNTERKGIFRDPKVFWYGPQSKWVMILGGEPNGLYESKNLVDWRYMSSFGWGECPDFFPLRLDNDAGEEKWVLVQEGGRSYFVGDFDGTRFVADHPHAKQWDFGSELYASSTWGDIPESDGRRIQISWMRPNGDLPSWPGRGHMSIPREITLKMIEGEPTIVQYPVKEFEKLRLPGISLTDFVVNGTRIAEEGAGKAIADISDASFEILVEFVVTGTEAKRFGVKVRAGPEHHTVVGYDVGTRSMFVDRRRSGRFQPFETDVDLHKAPLSPTHSTSTSSSVIRMRIVVDRSDVQAFGNDGIVAISDVILPDLTTDRGVSVFTDQGKVRVTRFEYHPLKSIWGESPLVSDLKGWRVISGEWKDTVWGKQGRGNKDEMVLSETFARDFEVSGDFYSLDGRCAIAFVFGSSADGLEAVFANLDFSANIIKVFTTKPWETQVLDEARLDIHLKKLKVYRYRARVVGDKLEVFFRDEETPRVSVTSKWVAGGGYVGLNVFAGTGAIQNIKFKAL
ncbi:hypothetical protein HDU97_009438 [Phlyctochytrium planicorne]|nr:hypothetical protein HDU97_009438 [Phlyctochytrium planicorne]